MLSPLYDKNLFGSDAASCQSAGKAVIWNRPRWEKPAAFQKGRPVPKEQPPRKLSGKRTSKVPSELWREVRKHSPKG